MNKLSKLNWILINWLWGVERIFSIKDIVEFLFKITKSLS